MPTSAACLLLLAGAIASCGSFGAADDPAPDVAMDGGGGADGAPGAPYCPKTGTFVCDDFEGATGFRWLGWSKDDEGGRNRIAVDELAGVPSATHALHASIASGASGPTDAYLEAKTRFASKLRLGVHVALAIDIGAHAVTATIGDRTETYALDPS